MVPPTAYACRVDQKSEEKPVAVLSVASQLVSEPLHRSLASSERGVGVLHPVVVRAPDLLLVLVSELAGRRLLRAQIISVGCFKQAMPLRRLLHEAQRCLFSLILVT